LPLLRESLKRWPLSSRLSSQKNVPVTKETVVRFVTCVTGKDTEGTCKNPFLSFATSAICGQIIVHATFAVERPAGEQVGKRAGIGIDLGCK
jgi:hypothetical protein